MQAAIIRHPIVGSLISHMCELALMERPKIRSWGPDPFRKHATRLRLSILARIKEVEVDYDVSISSEQRQR